jgi:Ser/Thr protein kinase RdoA (MazF antagonist)
VEPRAHVHDGFVITLWTYYAPTSPRDLAPTEFAHALARLHTSLRQVDLPAPHCTDRVADAQRLIDDRARTPGLAEADRTLLGTTLRDLSRAIGTRDAAKQLLHGEPHPGNVLRTQHGLRFIDLETCCRGPVEFDLAHAPEEVSAHYPGADQDLLRMCRVLMLAMITTWRWDRDDHFPHGCQRGIEWLSQLRAALDRTGHAQ